MHKQQDKHTKEDIIIKDITKFTTLGDNCYWEISIVEPTKTSFKLKLVGSLLTTNKQISTSCIERIVQFLSRDNNYRSRIMNSSVIEITTFDSISEAIKNIINKHC